MILEQPDSEPPYRLMFRNCRHPKQLSEAIGTGLPLRGSQSPYPQYGTVAGIREPPSKVWPGAITLKLTHYLKFWDAVSVNNPCMFY